LRGCGSAIPTAAALSSGERRVAAGRVVGQPVFCGPAATPLTAASNTRRQAASSSGVAAAQLAQARSSTTDNASMYGERTLTVVCRPG
jgi:hypothetical protein